MVCRNLRNTGRLPRLLALVFVGCVASGIHGYPLSSVQAADDSDQQQDRELAEKHGWIYNDLSTANSAAETSGKPLLVVIRCPP